MIGRITCSIDYRIGTVQEPVGFGIALFQAKELI